MHDSGNAPGLRHLLFDLDSTLTDTLQTFAMTRKMLFDRLSEWTDLDIARLKSEFHVLLQDDFHNPDLLRDLRCVKEASASCSEEKTSQLHQIERDYYALLQQEARLHDGGREALQALSSRGIDLAVWTNKKTPFAKLHIQQLGLDGVVSFLFSQQHTKKSRFDSVELQKTRVFEYAPGQKKPNPEMLRWIIATCGFDEAGTAFVGNNIKNDGGSTLGTSVKFILSDFGIPSVAIEQTVFDLTQSAKHSYRRARHGGPEHDQYRQIVKPVAVLRRSLLELLPICSEQRDSREATS